MASRMISIREMSESDLESMIEIFTDVRVFENFDSGPWSESKVSKSVERNTARWRSGEIGAHVICLDNEVIGKLIVFPNEDHEYELGFVLSPDYWGMGYATKAGNLGLKFLESATEADNVVCYARVTNQASIKVIRKLGFDEVSERQGSDGITRIKFQRPINKEKHAGTG